MKKWWKTAVFLGSAFMFGATEPDGDWWVQGLRWVAAMLMICYGIVVAAVCVKLADDDIRAAVEKGER